MSSVRMGVIGCGVIGQTHAKAFAGCSRARLVAVADGHAQKRAAIESLYSPLAQFENGLDLIRSGLVDAVSIATPHYSHPSLAIAALEQGLHVLVENPWRSPPRPRRP